MTAATNLEVAYESVRSISATAAIALRGLRTRHTALTYQQIGDAIGLDLVNLDATHFYLAYLALEAALIHEGWQEQGRGKSKRWVVEDVSA